MNNRSGAVMQATMVFVFMGWLFSMNKLGPSISYIVKSNPLYWFILMPSILAIFFYIVAKIISDAKLKKPFKDYYISFTLAVVTLLIFYSIDIFIHYKTGVHVFLLVILFINSTIILLMSDDKKGL